MEIELLSAPVSTKAMQYFWLLSTWVSLILLGEYLWLQYRRRRAWVRFGCSAPTSLLEEDGFLGLGKLKRSAERIKQKSYLELSQERFETAGNHTYMSTLLGRRIIDTRAPRNIRAILATNFKDWELGENRRWAFAPLLGNGIFAADGHQWRSSRALLKPSFAFDFSDKISVFEAKFQCMLRIIENNRILDLSELFGDFTLDCATQIFFGSSFDTLEARQRQGAGSDCACMGTRFAAAFNRCQRVMANHLVLGRIGSFLFNAGPNRAFNTDCREVLRFVGKAVDRALQGRDTDDSASTSFLHALLRSNNNINEVRSELVNVLVAGRDTTSSLLSNLFFTLARKPGLYARLRKEILSVVNDTELVPSADELKNMPFLKACISEALRLFPPVPVNTRTAVQDTMLPMGGGEYGEDPIFVPKGMQVGFNTYAMHRSERYWGRDANEYVPDRWIRGGEFLQPGWEYLPFSGGPRVCIGQKLALLQVSFVTCRLVQHFRVLEAAADNVANQERPSDMRIPSTSEKIAPTPSCSWRWTESLTLTLSSAAGAWVNLVK